MYTIYENGQIHSGKLDIYLKGRQSPNGYLTVDLDGDQQSIHRLVCLHFLPNPYKYSCVNHKNGDKQDNHLQNLEWCSHEMNMQHALETGLRKGFIHVDMKRLLLDRVLQGETAKDLAQEIGNHPNTLNRMLRNQAIKDNKEAEWDTEARRKRKMTAVKNLEHVNDQHI